MSVSSTKTLKKPKYLVYKIVHEYDDFEQNLHKKDINYVEKIDDLPAYFNDVLEWLHILDVSHYPMCRMNMTFKITPVKVSYNKYVSLFKSLSV